MCDLKRTQRDDANMRTIRVWVYGYLIATYFNDITICNLNISCLTHELELSEQQKHAYTNHVTRNAYHDRAIANTNATSTAVCVCKHAACSMFAY